MDEFVIAHTVRCHPNLGHFLDESRTLNRLALGNTQAAVF